MVSVVVPGKDIFEYLLLLESPVFMSPSSILLLTQILLPVQTQTPTPSGSSNTSPANVIPQWIQFPGWRWVVALAVVIVGIVISRYITRLIGRQVARRFQRQSVAQTALRLVRLSIVLFTVAVAASIVGLQVGDIVLSVTVFSAVLGIVLAPIAGSIVNGLFILADQPYEIGDMIELDDGRRGFIDDITIRYTKIFTLDNTFLVVPNSSIREQLVTNFSAEDERVRQTLDIAVTYESDLERARELIQRAAASIDDVIEGGPDIRVGNARYPARPTVFLDSFGDDGIVLRLRYWVVRPYRLQATESDVADAIWSRFHEDAAELEFAYPHRHLVFDHTSGSLDATVKTGPASGKSPTTSETNTNESENDDMNSNVDTSTDTQAE